MSLTRCVVRHQVCLGQAALNNCPQYECSKHQSFFSSNEVCVNTVKLSGMIVCVCDVCVPVHACMRKERERGEGGGEKNYVSVRETDRQTETM